MLNHHHGEHLEPSPCLGLGVSPVCLAVVIHPVAAATTRFAGILTGPVVIICTASCSQPMLSISDPPMVLGSCIAPDAVNIRGNRFRVWIMLVEMIMGSDVNYALGGV